MGVRDQADIPYLEAAGVDEHVVDSKKVPCSRTYSASLLLTAIAVSVNRGFNGWRRPSSGSTLKSPVRTMG